MQNLRISLLNSRNNFRLNFVGNLSKHFLKFASVIKKYNSYKNQAMLQIAFIRENQEKVIKALAKRNIDAKSVVEEVVQLDENRRAAQVELDNTLAESNKLSKDIGELMKAGEKVKAAILKEKTVSLKEKSKELGEKAEASFFKLNIFRFVFVPVKNSHLSVFLISISYKNNCQNI